MNVPVRLVGSSVELGTPSVVMRLVEAAGVHPYPYDVAADGRILALTPASGGGDRPDADGTHELAGHRATITIDDYGMRSLRSSIRAGAEVWDHGPSIDALGVRIRADCRRRFLAGVRSLHTVAHHQRSSTYALASAQHTARSVRNCLSFHHYRHNIPTRYTGYRPRRSVGLRTGHVRSPEPANRLKAQMLDGAVEDNLDAMHGRLPKPLRPVRRRVQLWARGTGWMALPVVMVMAGAGLARWSQPVPVPTLAPAVALSSGRRATSIPLPPVPSGSVLSQPIRPDVLSLAVHRVILDAGHGGDNLGTASAKGLLEKDSDTRHRRTRSSPRDDSRVRRGHDALDGRDAVAAAAGSRRERAQRRHLRIDSPQLAAADERPRD